MDFLLHICCACGSYDGSQVLHPLAVCVSGVQRWILQRRADLRNYHEASQPAMCHLQDLDCVPTWQLSGRRPPLYRRSTFCSGAAQICRPRPCRCARSCCRRCRMAPRARWREASCRSRRGCRLLQVRKDCTTLSAEQRAHEGDGLNNTASKPDIVLLHGAMRCGAGDCEAVKQSAVGAWML